MDEGRLGDAGVGVLALATLALSAGITQFGTMAWLIGLGFGAAGAGLLYQSLKSELSPSEDRGFFITLVLAPEGASMDYTDGYMRQIEALEKLLRAIQSAKPDAGLR